MAVEAHGYGIGFMEAGVDLSGSQNRCVRVSAADNFRWILPAAGGEVDGVLVDFAGGTGGIGSVCNVVCQGVVKIEKDATGAITRGDYLAAGADGRVHTAAIGERRIGRALQSAGAAAVEQLSVLLLGNHMAPPLAAITALTDNSGGAANNTIEDVPAAYNEAALANNFADLAAKVNEIITALRNAGIAA